MNVAEKNLDAQEEKGAEELKKVSSQDPDRPSLFPFFLMEFLKYGTLILVCYITYMFIEPYIEEVQAYTAWLLDDSQ